MYLQLNGVANPQWGYMQPFGYLRQTALIGRGQCNNPLYGKKGGNPIVATDDPHRTGFDNHAFCLVPATGHIADACAGPHLGTETPDSYVAAAVDDMVPAKPAYFQGTSASITYCTGVTSVTKRRIGPEPQSHRVPNPQAVNEFLKSIGQASRPPAKNALPPPVRVWPDPLACPALGTGWMMGYEELIPGYPESTKLWRLRHGLQTLTITLYVASDGPVTAEHRFLVLGTVHQAAGSIYKAGPEGLGTASAVLNADGYSRLFWLDDNAVVDLLWVNAAPISDTRFRPELERVARWFISSIGTPADSTRTLVKVNARASTLSIRVDDIFGIHLDTANSAVIDAVQIPETLQLVEITDHTLTFRGRDAGKGEVQLVAIDPRTLLGTSATVTIEVRGK